MNDKEAAKLIEEIETRLSALKSGLGVSTESGASKPKKKASKAKVGARGKTGATEPIKALIESGFFDTAKSDLEVLAALKKKALTFKRKAVATTLMRQVRTGFLSRDGAGTKEEPWRYKKA